MKAFIIVFTMVIGVIINTLIGDAIGFKASELLLFIIYFSIAKKLCEKWDKYKAEKEAIHTSDFGKTEEEDDW